MPHAGCPRSDHGAVVKTPSIFGATLLQEWRLFQADRLTMLITSILLAAALYGLNNGRAAVERQQRAIAQAQAEEQARLAEQRDNLTAMQEGRYTAATAYRNPANPLWVGNRHAASYAVLPPAPLALTAIGQSDLNPSYVLVSADSRDTFAFNEEIENPGNLLIGHFDLAFFVVFLYPLLIIALTYNVLSGERERGTLAMLMSNPVRLGTVLLGKLVFRALVVIPPLLLATMAMIAFDGISTLLSAEGIARCAAWAALITAYGVFWFALAGAVTALGRPSEYNIFVLISLWVVLSLIVPTLLGVVVNVAHPVPSRVEMINALRALQTEAGREYDASAARYQEEHSALAGGDGGILNQRDLNAAHRRVRVQQAAAIAAQELMAQHDERLMRQQETVTRLRFLSPAIVVQEGLNDIAGTGNSRYRDYQAQVDRFHAQWRAFFTPKVMENVALTMEDYDRFPRFRYQPQPLSGWTPALLQALLGLLLPALLLGFAGSRWLSRYPIRE